MSSIELLSEQMVASVRAAIEKQVTPLVARIATLEAQLKALPEPQVGPKGDPGESGKDGKDGVGLQGERGDPGKDGTSVHPDTVTLLVREAADKVAASMPKPKDGRDGFSLDDFDAALDGRMLTLKFARGDVVREKALPLPMLIWRDIWREGEYERGDVVTWGGSSWHCQNKTTGKPGECDDWKMMVKKGAAGRDWNDPKAKSENPVVRLK